MEIRKLTNIVGFSLVLVFRCLFYTVYELPNTHYNVEGILSLRSRLM